METLATTRMSSKGQVVIPEAVRTRLGLEAGAQFVVVGEDDLVIKDFRVMNIIQEGLARDRHGIGMQ